MILYVFISCQTHLESHYERISEMMQKHNYKDYIYVVGGVEEINYNEERRILSLNCNDFYEGLPEKVLMCYQYLFSAEQFRGFKYFCKLDIDMVIKKLFTKDLLSDYCGKINRKGKGNRSWHMGKCSQSKKGKRFNNTPYKGTFPDWSLGGYGYILSRKALKILGTEINIRNAENEIFEDVFIGKLLENKIRAKDIKHLKQYIISPDHK